MPSSVVKKNLGFIYHEPGRAVDMGKALQFNVPRSMARTISTDRMSMLIC